MKSLVTKSFGITNAKNFEKMVSVPLANVYILIGRSLPWANTANAANFDDVTITTPHNTTHYENGIKRDGLILTRITSNDIQPVIPRVDWSNNTVYVAYDQTANLFIKVLDTQVSGGNVNVSAGLANTVNANGINFTSSSPVISVGDYIKIGTEIKEVIKSNATALVVNSNFTSAYTSANIFEVNYSTTQYSNKFYVRNGQDQVFKCIKYLNVYLITMTRNLIQCHKLL